MSKTINLLDAKKYKIGRIFIDEKSNVWINLDKTGTKQWYPYIKKGEKEKSYEIHDNWGRPLFSKNN